jgi:hypothetical protein
MAAESFAQRTAVLPIVCQMPERRQQLLLDPGLVCDRYQRRRDELVERCDGEV